MLLDIRIHLRDASKTSLKVDVTEITWRSEGFEIHSEATMKPSLRPV